MQNMQSNEVNAMIEYENDFIQVFIDEGICFMISEWKRNVSSKEYRKGHLTFITMLKNHTISHWIIDSTKLGEISVDDEEWFLNVMIPEILKTDVKKVARVSGEINPGYNRLETFLEQVKEAFLYKVEVRNCITFKEAADWMANICD